jgi:biopolymer transport protein ExbB
MGEVVENILRIPAIQRLVEIPLVEQALTIWGSGGWAMIALAANAFVLFAVGAKVWLRLRTKGFKSVREKTWRRWIANPGERRGSIGKLIEFVMEATSLKDLGVRFAELHSTELAPFERDLRFMRRAVSTAPLLGLLGTVTGMLTTFHALAVGSGGEKTMELVAGGISEALITTETGLVIALPGLFFQYHLTRQRDRYDAFLSHLETVCTQYLCVWSRVRKVG